MSAILTGAAGRGKEGLTGSWGGGGGGRLWRKVGGVRHPSGTRFVDQ